MHAGGEHLREHPGVGSYRRFIDPVHRHVDDHRRRAMTAPGRAAGDQSFHVLGQALDVVRRVLHVVADVVGPRLRVLDALFEASLGAVVRARVVDRLTLREQLDRAVDARRFRVLRRDAHEAESEGE